MGHSICWHAKYNPACCLAAFPQVSRPLSVLIKRMPGHTTLLGHTILPVRYFAMILYNHRAATKFVNFMTGLSSDCWTRKSKQWFYNIQKATRRMNQLPGDTWNLFTEPGGWPMQTTHCLQRRLKVAVLSKNCVLVWWLSLKCHAAFDPLNL